MLFKRKEKLIEEHPTEETISELRDKQMRKQINRDRIKRWIINVFIVFGLLGGYLSYLKTDSQDNIAEAAASQTFVKTYLEQYFSYPMDDAANAYLKQYTLDNSWRVEYDRAVKEVSVEGSEVYKVLSPTKEITSFYVYLDISMISVDEEKQEISDKYRLSVRLDLAREQGGYLIVEPLKMTAQAIEAIAEEEREKFVLEMSEGKEQLTDQEKANVQETLRLFYATYSNNIAQAKLLVMDLDLENLDSNTTLVFTSLNRCTKDDTTYYATAALTEIIADKMIQKKNVYVEIDIEKNKIKKMEEY